MDVESCLCPFFAIIFTSGILQAVNLPPTKDGKEEVTTEQLELLRQVINEPVQLRKPTAGTLFFCVFFWDSSDNLEGMGCAVLDFRNDISETNHFSPNVLRELFDGELLFHSLTIMFQLICDHYFG